MILVILFWLIMARKNSLVPSKGQFIGETAYFFVRNGIARDMIGHDFRRYLPFLIALFSFILVNNLWGIFPLTLVPTASHVGWAYGLALMVVGALQRRRHRQARAVRLPQAHHAAVRGTEGDVADHHPAGVLLQHHRATRDAVACDSSPTCSPATCWCWSSCWAGSILLLHTDSIVNKLAGVVAWIFSMAIFGLEVFVQSLQAFIFTVLTANYISSAAAEEH